MYWSWPAAARRGDYGVGAKVASDLGWPREMMGLTGASASMVNIGAPWHQMKSMLWLVQQRQRESDAEVRRIVAESAARHLAAANKD